MWRSVLLLLPLFLLLARCAPSHPSPPTPPPTLSGRITFAGSTTVQPLASRLGSAFRARHPAVTLEIAAGGSLVGIQAVHDGTADIGMSSRALQPPEAEGLQPYPIALDVLAVVVNSANPVAGLTRAELRAIYTGEITSWREVGGPDLPIVVVVRERSSGTRGAFDELALGGAEPVAPGLLAAVTAGDAAAAVARERGAIGYVGFGNLDAALRVIPIDGVAPTPESARDGAYPLVRPLLLLTGPLTQPLAENFIAFATGPQGQAIVAEQGWVLAR